MALISSTNLSKKQLIYVIDNVLSKEVEAYKSVLWKPVDKKLYKKVIANPFKKDIEANFGTTTGRISSGDIKSIARIKLKKLEALESTISKQNQKMIDLRKENETLQIALREASDIIAKFYVKEETKQIVAPSLERIIR
jgi:hypothetical protein